MGTDTQTESLNRVTRSAVYAKYCSPCLILRPWTALRVVTQRTKGASEVRPVELTEGEDYQVVDTEIRESSL